MCTSVEFVPYNGKYITRLVSAGHAIDSASAGLMERSELTLSFHNLIKRGSALIL